MARSPYIDSVVLTHKHSGRRTHKVEAFVLHHMAAVWTGMQCALYLRDTPSREASANYNIGYAGDAVLSVEEGNRAWTTSSAWADNRAITYELANSKRGYPWPVSDATINKAIVMLAEQHKRYGLRASYTGDTSGTLWRHDWFAETNCPGPYLGGMFSYIADEINKILDGKSANGIERVEEDTGSFKTNDDILVRDRPSTNGKHIATYKKGEILDAYNRVHYGNGYVWLEYIRVGAKPAKGYLPIRTYQNGVYGDMWGEIGEVGDYVSQPVTPEVKPVSKPQNPNKGYKFRGQGHVEGRGWVPMVGNTIGTTGEKRRLEAFNLTVEKDGKAIPVFGEVHIQGLGDVSIHTNLLGTAGEKRRLEAVKLDIHDDIEYRVHMQLKGWSPWTKNNEWAGSKGKERRIEAIEFRVK